MPIDCATYCPKCGQFHLETFDCGVEETVEVASEEVAETPVEEAPVEEETTEEVIETVEVEKAEEEDLEAAGIEEVTTDGDTTTVEFQDGTEMTAPTGSVTVEDVPSKPTPKRRNKRSK